MFDTVVAVVVVVVMVMATVAVISNRSFGACNCHYGCICT